MSDVYSSYFGNYSAAVLGVGGTVLVRSKSSMLTQVGQQLRTRVVAGDQTANLWWRLQNGDIFTQHPPQVSIVLIGTNDLGAASCGAGEAGAVAAVSGVVSR